MDQLLSAKDAAQSLGISTVTFYDWLAHSDAGDFSIRGQRVTIDYLQGGPRGQGRIKIEATEIARLKDLMRVRPPAPRVRSPAYRCEPFPGITVRLGRPND